MKQFKSPVYLYDEPAEYKNFTGGMNTSKNDLSLLENQFKLGLNLDYDEKNLTVRQGGKEYINFISPTELNNIQGIFLFSSSTKYIIVANNGKLYFGVYEPNSTIHLSLLRIIINENVLSVDTYKVTNNLLEFTSNDIPTQNHDGYIELTSQMRYLVFQNKFKIEAIQYKNTMYMATGTRFIEIKEQYDGSILATIVRPYKPNSIEYTQIGTNLLSFVPSVHVKTENKGVATAIHNIVPLKEGSQEIVIKTVMTYGGGETKNDYRFKWEKSSDGIEYEPVYFEDIKSEFKNNISLGKDQIRISIEEAELFTYRCSFAKSFKMKKTTIRNSEDPSIIEFEDEENVLEDGDWVIDKVDGEWYGQAQSIPYNTGLYKNSNEYYDQIQSCKKIFGYGNKFLLYDDAYNSGNMWKTAIDNPYYITYKGGLNFKTDKDEQITKIINFKGILIAFSYNELLGGNISVVNGNGDDYNDGNNYSPFSKRIINKVITTDNPGSVQVAENIIIFKFKESLFMIQGSDLNYEIVDVQEINTHIKQENIFIKIPFNNNDCISELTPNYYALYWKEKYDLNNQLIHPAYRLKLYYKNTFTEGIRTIFPALIDESNLFNTDFIIQVAGENYILHKNLLVSFNQNHYLDLDKEYKHKLITRGFELGYPQFIKSIRKLMITYTNDEKKQVDLKIDIYNEAMFEMLKQKRIVLENNTIQEGDNIIKTDDMITNYLIITPEIRENCMNATVSIEATARAPLIFNSITFFYIAKALPKKNPLDNYKKTIRKGERLVK